MDQPSFPLAISPTPRRRGRPPGARNRRSIDLARYVEARFGGMTPGQQAAEICMVTAKELKAAKGDITLAMAAKARELAGAIGCTTAEAWLLLAKERDGLMAYVHQKQAQAVDRGQAAPATVFIVPEGLEQPILEFVDDLADDDVQVGWPKSDDAT